MPVESYAFALGRLRGAWQFARPDLRRAAQFSAISQAWTVYLRDAGAGDVGPAHRPASDASHVLSSIDPRRDQLLLWLADHAATGVGEAATTLARAVSAEHRFGGRELAMLDAARDAIRSSNVSSGPIARLLGSLDVELDLAHIVATAVDGLRSDPDFAETTGTDVRLALPAGTMTRYVSPAPGGTWALNLALLAEYQPVGAAPLAGIVSRALFRGDLDSEEVAETLVANILKACRDAFDRLETLEAQFGRGEDALRHMSRHARARPAWHMVAAVGSITRAQLARALGLSRAGADIQAHALSQAGLVTLDSGKIRWQHSRKQDVRSMPLDQGPLARTIQDLDASMEKIERLLDRYEPDRSYTSD